MKKILVSLLIIGLAIQSNAQEETTTTEKLSTVVLHATNYKYINAVNNEEAALPVKLLQQKVADYDIRNSEIYNDEYDSYNVSFHIPDGHILAAYDKNGVLLRTVEKFRNINLPRTVTRSILNNYPGWNIDDDVYYITYHDEKGTTKKYKILLEKDGKIMRVKVNPEGDIF